MKQDHREGEMDEGGETLTTAPTLNDDVLELVKPSGQLFDLPTRLVSVQWSAALGDGPHTVAPMERYQFNALGSEYLIGRITVTGLIPGTSSEAFQG
jgi:hypothetical protein